LGFSFDGNNLQSTNTVYQNYCQRFSSVIDNMRRACYKPPMITAAQSRAARGLIEWSQEQLAVESHLGLSTIRDFEKGRRAPTHNNLMGIKMAFEAAGVVFVPASPEGGGGVRLGKTPDNAADLTRSIDTIEDDLAKSEGPSARTPAGGMRTLERAHKREAVKKLKNRRTKLKTK
jgi:transcriptional regulator with XRE-family HTH domain